MRSCESQVQAKPTGLFYHFSAAAVTSGYWRLLYQKRALVVSGLPVPLIVLVLVGLFIGGRLAFLLWRKSCQGEAEA